MCVLSSNCMSTKEGRYDAHRQCLFHSLNHTKHLQLIFGVETITALYLYAACSLEYHFVYASSRLFIKLIFTHCVEQISRIEYASATFGNLFIAKSPDFIHKFTFATACIHYVGVWVAPRREQPPPLCVNHYIASWHGTYVHAKLPYLAIFDCEKSIIDMPYFRHSFTLKAIFARSGDSGKHFYVLYNCQHSAIFLGSQLISECRDT